MVEPDTIKLLRECDAGIKMGVNSISDVLDNVRDAKLKEMLTKCKDKHDALQDEIDKLLQEYHDEGKEPNVMAQGMSWIKTNVQLAMDDSDATIAELMTDGCDMGIKSLSRYLNQYEAADDKAKAITKKLINLENDLCSGLREYLQQKSVRQGTLFCYALIVVFFSFSTVLVDRMIRDVNED